MTTNSKMVEVEADTLEEARKKIAAQIPEGWEMRSEQVVTDGTRKPRVAQTVEMEADSLEQARTQLESGMAQGLELLSEEVISGGNTMAERATADSVEAALAHALQMIPKGAIVLQEDVLISPQHKTAKIQALHEKDAELSASSEARALGTEAVVTNIRLVAVGKKGFLGIGREFDRYEAEISVPAVVEVTFRPRVKVRFHLGSYDKPKARVRVDVGRSWDSFLSQLAKHEQVSGEASVLVSEAIDIVEKQVKVGAGFVQISGSGSDGQVMEAVDKLYQAHKLQPENPLLHYAWASALILAAQFESAEGEIKSITQLHPDFLLAKFALEGWGGWKSHFTLPSWNSNTKSVPAEIAAMVKTTILLSVRDGITPRAALFSRDNSGDFQDLAALNSARIDITSFLSPVTTPQLMSVYAKIWDNPTSPYDVEELRAPLYKRGHPTRCTFEYLVLQQDIDFVIMDAYSNILLNKRLAMPNKMRRTHQQLVQLLESSDGREISTSELLSAMQSHQRQVPLADVRF